MTYLLNINNFSNETDSTNQTKKQTWLYFCELNKSTRIGWLSIRISLPVGSYLISSFEPLWSKWKAGTINLIAKF